MSKGQIPWTFQVICTLLAEVWEREKDKKVPKIGFNEVFFKNVLKRSVLFGRVAPVQKLFRGCNSYIYISTQESILSKSIKSCGPHMQK